MKTTYYCPTTKGPRNSNTIGCGAMFEQEPDAEGLVDCPECGICFSPERETPPDAVLLKAADRLHGVEGECEVDESIGDPTAMVSRGDDPGAYVRAWVWVPFCEVTDEDWEGHTSDTVPARKSVRP